MAATRWASEVAALDSVGIASQPEQLGVVNCQQVINDGQECSANKTVDKAQPQIGVYLHNKALQACCRAPRMRKRQKNTIIVTPKAKPNASARNPCVRKTVCCRLNSSSGSGPLPPEDPCFSTGISIFLSPVDAAQAPLQVDILAVAMSAGVQREHFKDPARKPTIAASNTSSRLPGALV